MPTEKQQGQIAFEAFCIGLPFKRIHPEVKESWAAVEAAVEAAVRADERAKIDAELKALRKNNKAWIAANGPNGWIDELRRDKATLATALGAIRGILKYRTVCGQFPQSEPCPRCDMFEVINNASLPHPAPEVSRG